MSTSSQKKILGTIFLCCVAISSRADVHNVTQDESFATLDAAYQAAIAGDTLVLDDGIYDVSSGFTLDKEITVQAANVGGVLLDRGGLLGPVVELAANATLSGVTIGGGSIGILLRDAGEVTGTFTDILIRNMSLAIVHDNGADGTAGAMDFTNLTIYSVGTAVEVNDGGKISIANAIFASVDVVATVSGSNEGSDSISIDNYLLDTIRDTFIASPDLVTASNEVVGDAEFADIPTNNFARLEGAAGEGTLGISLDPVPRQKLVVKGNGLTIENSDATPSAADLTDFGEVHGGSVNSLAIENEGFSESIQLTGGTGELVQVDGTHADQFAVLSQPATNTLSPQNSDSFEIFYAPSTLGRHDAVVIVPNDSTDTSPYSFAITGTSINAAPIANADTGEVDEDNEITLQPLANDTDADDDTLEVVGATVSAGQGAVSFTTSSITYVPLANFNGLATISYQVSDSFEEDAADIAVTVNPVNDAPTLTNDTANTPEDEPITVAVLANDSDVEGDIMSVTGASVQSGQGTASVSDVTVTYSPGQDFNGAAVIQYTVTDGSDTASALLNIDVSAVNDAPVANADTAVAIEDQAATYNVLANDIDVDGDTLTITQTEVTLGNGAATIDTNGVTFTPALDFTGTAIIAYEISDGSLSDRSTLTLDVRGENDAPVGVDDAVTIDEDTSATVDVLENDTDSDGDTLSISSVSLESGEGSVSFAGSVTYVPTANFNGTATISYVLSDGLASDTALLTVTVNPVDDAPVANDDTASTDEDSPVTANVLANDTDVDSATLTISDAQVISGEGDATVAGDDITFTPATDFNGTAVIRYVVSDDSHTDTALLTVTVAAVNDAPVGVDDVASTQEDVSLTVDVLANDTDVESSLQLVSAAVVAGNANVMIDSNHLVLTPAMDFHGTVLVAYEISDGEATDTAQLTVTVTPVNDAPVAGDTGTATDEDVGVTVDVLSSAFDVDGDALSIASASVVSGPGDVAVIDGLIHYLPAPNAFGIVNVTYTVSDGALTHAANLAITVRPVNDLPQIVNDDYVIAENESVALDVLANDSDADDALALLSVSVVSGHGTARVSNGLVEFSPAPFAVDDVVLEYTAWDTAAQASGEITIHITPAVVRGNIPLGSVDGIAGIPLLAEALSLAPMDVVDGYEETRDVTDDGVSRYALTGQVSLTIPGALNLPDIVLHGADVLAYAEQGDDHSVNSFFVKISLYSFLKRMFATTEVPPEIIGLIPDVPVIIAYSDVNLDEQTIADMPAPARTFFAGVFDSNFGVPIHSDTGSLNLFIPSLGYDLIPATIRQPLADVGINAQFVEDNLGVGGRVTVMATVESLGQLLDVLAFLIPQAQPAGFSITGMPAFEFGLLLPGVSLPGWLSAGASQIPMVQALGFEPDAAFQLRYFMGLPDFDFSSGQLVGIGINFGIEGNLRVQMPNLVNADSLKDAPGREALDIRGRMEHEFEASVNTDGVQAKGGMAGTLHLRNEWINPLGIPGVSIANAVIRLGGAVSAGGKVSNVGAGFDVDVGLGGQFSCLSDEGERLGTAAMAGALAIKIGAGIPIRGFGISVEQPAMSFVERLKCGVRVQLGTVLGMGDTLVALVPEPSAQQVIRDINSAATGDIKGFADSVIEAPLQFPPLGAALDQFRFTEGILYLATPGIELPGHIDGIGLRIAGGAEYRTSRQTEDWIEIGQVSFEGGLAEGIHGAFSVGDFNVGDLIQLQNVAGGLDLQVWPPQAELQLSGSQRLFGLTSQSEVMMSLERGILLDSTTAIEGLGMMSVNAETFGRLDQWPPVEPLDMRGSTRLTVNPNDLADSLHSVAGNITGDAANAYRTALDRLNRDLSAEQDLRSSISTLEAEVRDATDRINAELRPRFAYVRERLYEAERAADYFYDEARWYERSHDSRPWWDVAGKAYDWGRAKVNWGLYGAAKLALPGVRALVDAAESALSAALYEVTSALEPRLTALRVSLAAVQTAKAAIIVSIQGLEAANNAARAVSDALRSASNIVIHDASANINSLLKFQLGTEPLTMNLDFELGAVGIRCTSTANFRLSDPVGSVLSAARSQFSGCAAAHTEAAESRALIAAKSALLTNTFANDQAGVQITAAPPANDAFDSATVITGPVPVQVQGTTAGAATEASDLTTIAQSGSIWWRWQPPASGYYQVSATGGDTGLQIHAADQIASGQETSLLAADIRPIVPGQVIYEFSADQEYLIAVTSQFTDPGAVTLSIDAVDLTVTSAPAHDNLNAAALATERSGTDTALNALASIEPGEHAGDALPLFNTLWWQFTAPRSATYTFDTLSSDVDTVVRAYTSAPGDAAPSHDNLAWLKTSNDVGLDPSSVVNLRLNEGDTVYVSVGTRYDVVGNIRFNWRSTDGTPDELAYDNLESAQHVDLGPGSTVISNLGATTEVDEPLHAGVSNHASVWLTLDAQASGTYVIDTRGSDPDTVLALYTGTGLDSLEPMNNLQTVASNDDVDSDNSYSRLRVALDADTLYLLAVSGKHETEGSITLNVAGTPQNDAFAQRAVLAQAGSMAVDITEASLEVNEPDYPVILATDQSPDALVDSLAAALGAAEDPDAPPPPELLTLQQLAETLYADTLARLQANPLAHTLWYEYTAAADGDLVISTTDSGVDTALVVFTGDDIEALVPLAFSDDADGSVGALARLPAESGERYVIALAAREGGVVPLTWQLIPLSDQFVANDHPDGALAIELTSTEPASVSAANAYAKTSFSNETVATPPKALSIQSGTRLWWQVASTQTGTVTVDTQGSGLDTLIEAYRLNSRSELVLVTLNDNFEPASNLSRVRFPIAAGETWYVAVDSLNNEVGTVHVNAALEFHATVPDNDRLAGAEQLAGTSVSLLADTAHVQYQLGEPQLGALERPNMAWYRWDAAESGRLVIDTSGSAFDTVLGLFESDGAAHTFTDLTRIDSNDDANAETTASRLAYFVEAGVTYYIGVAGKRGVQGDLTLTLNLEAPANDTLPAHANIQGSITIESSTIDGDLFHVSSAAATGSGLVRAVDDVASARWYAWTAPADGTFLFSTRGSEIMPIVEIYTGEADAIVLMDRDNGSAGAGQFSAVTLNVAAGEQVYIRLTSAFARQGSYSLSIIEVEGTSEEEIRQLGTDEGGVTPARIDGAGTFRFQWQAPRDGLVLVSLPTGDPAAQDIEIYRVSEGELQAQTEVDVDQPDGVTADGVSTQFLAEAGATYQLHVVANTPVLGNAQLAFAYQGAATIALDTPAVATGVAEVQQLLLTQTQSVLAGTFDVALFEAEILTSLGGLIDAAGSNTEDLSLAVAKQDNRVVLTLTDTVQRSVLLSMALDPQAAVAGALERHTQIGIGDPAFSLLGYRSVDDEDLPAGVQVPVSAFDITIRQAFVSASRWSLETLTDVPGNVTQFQAGYLYDISLYAFGGAGQLLDLDDESISAVDGVNLRLPIDADALLAWLDAPELTNEQAEARLLEALEQGVLQLVSAEHVTDFNEGVYEALAVSQATFDLEAGFIEFATPHFSSFALVANQPADEIEAPESPDVVTPPAPQPRVSRGGCSLGGHTQSVDPALPLLLVLSLLYLWRRRTEPARRH